MTLKALQWNIGGAFIRNPSDSADKMASYQHPDLRYVIDFLQKENADVITLQEVHADDTFNQAEAIARALGYETWVYDPYDASHIDPSQQLGQAVIARGTLTRHDFSFFLNPHLETVSETGDSWHTHNKGVTTCDLLIEGTALRIQTMHSVPLTKFGKSADDPIALAVYESMNALLDQEARHILIQGDFNIDSVLLADYFPAIGESGISEVKAQPTTPKGRRYDHTLWRGLKHVSTSAISDVLTDHYPLVSAFEINES